MAIVITGCIAFGNLFVLMKMSYDKIMLKIKQKKAKKFFLDRFSIVRFDTEKKLSNLPSKGPIY